jgi:hypothetical protein
MISARLHEAYARAEYRVRLKDGELVLRVGRVDALADARLKASGVCDRWAVLTPCNPRSQPTSPAFNQQYLDELRRALDTALVAYFDAVNRDPGGNWPDEPGFLLCDPAAGLAEDLGRRFRQNALLVGALGQSPNLFWLG